MNTETLTQSFKPFPAYTCSGDVRTVEHGPFTIRATVHDDTDTTPDDFDCYSPESIAAWRAGDWCYVGIVLSVWLDDICIDDHAASLWGITCNVPTDDNSYLSECANDLLPEALEAAERARRKLVETLAKAAP